MSEFTNPFYAFFEIWIGEVNISLLPPQHTQQFTYIRKPYNSANKFIIALFDETALLVEQQLVEGYQSIKFRYGYVNGTQSPTYSGMVTQYDVDFNPAGAILTIEGLSDSVSTFSNPKSDVYTDMTIDQIVRKIADEEGWTIGILEPCESVSDGNTPNKTFTRSNQNAQEFIVNDLIPDAKSAATGDSNYVLNFEDKEEGTVVNFYPQVQAAALSESEVHNYEFQWGAGDRKSKVLEFNPDYSGTLCLMSGGATVDSSTIDRITNNIVNMSFTNTDDPNRIVLADRSGYDYQGATRFIGGSAQSYDEMKKTAAYLWYVNASSPVTADLTVMGDPLINAFDTVSIVMLNKDGLPHHSSGIYLVKEIEDDIVGGSFTTKMTLFRNSMEIGPNESGGININLVADRSIDSVSDIFNSTSGSGNNDIVAVALAEEGYREGANGYTKYGDWYADGFENSHWCAMFVSWCAEQAGISNDIVPRMAYCPSIVNWFKSKGQWVSARSRGGPNYSPKAGDIVLFAWGGVGDNDADHVGIVVRSDETTLYTIEGNTSDMVAQRTYSLTSTSLLGYGTPAYVVTSTTGSGLYTQGNSNEETIFCFLTQSMGLNTAAACGVLANVYHESGFRPDALGDNGTSYGICQWHAGRYTNLRSWCSSNGYDYKTLEGQLYFLNHELSSSYSKVLNKLRNASNSASGAYQAGSDWCTYFEVPANTAVRARERGNKAQTEYWPKYQNYTPSGTPGGTIPSSSTNNTVFVGNSLAYGLAQAAGGTTKYCKVGGTIDSSEVQNGAKDAGSYDSIIIELGSNELYAGWSSDKFTQKLRTLITTMRSKNSRINVYVVSIPPVASNSRYNRSTDLNNTRISSWNSKIKTLCSSISYAYFIDSSSYFNNNNSIYASDGLHLNNYSGWLSVITRR